jgi:hypothetical protein
VSVELNMTTPENNRLFRLHFEGPRTRGRTLPAPALVLALQQFQRVIHLLAMAHEGRAVRQRARRTHDIERRFPVLCRLPEEGGYALPIEVGDVSYQLFDEQVVTAVAERTREVMRAVSSGDEQNLGRLVPESYYRVNVLRSIRAMQPAGRSGITVSVEEADHTKILNGAVARDRTTDMLKEPDVATPAHPVYLAGTLIEMKFNERRLRLQLPKTGHALEATYGEDFEPVLLEHPRDLIQVHGNVVYQSDGTPESISDVDDILEVDESPIEINLLNVGELTLQVRNPLTFSVSFDSETGLYEAAGPFDVLVVGNTRPELEALLEAELVVLWREYASAKPASLTAAAKRLRSELQSAFEERSDATE